MPVRYYRAPFQPQQPGGLGDIFNKAAQTMVWGAQTPDQLAELRARTGLLGSQQKELDLKNTQTQGGLDYDKAAAPVISGFHGGNQGDLYSQLAGMAAGFGQDPTIAGKLTQGLVATHGGTEDDLARGYAAMGNAPTGDTTAYLPGTKQGIQSQAQDASKSQAFGVANIAGATSRADTAANNAGAMARTQADLANRSAIDQNDQYGLGKRSELDRAERLAQAYMGGQFGQQRAETAADAREYGADASAAARGGHGYTLKPEDMPALSHTIETMAGGQGMLSDQELADTLQRAGEIYHQGGDAATAAGQAFHEKFGASPEISHGFLGFGKGVSPDPNMHPAVAAALSSGTAPTSSPPAAPTTVPNPQAASGGPQAAASAAGPPPAAVDMLRKNPHLADMFDQKYGAGSAGRVLGGT